MSHSLEVSLSQLYTDIHEAFKQWQHKESGDSPLGYLKIVQQHPAAVEGKLREATNSVLEQAMTELAEHSQRMGQVLRSRFVDKEYVYQVASEFDIAESTVYREQREAMERLALTLKQRELRARTVRQGELEARLEPAPSSDLIGVEEQIERLRATVLAEGPPWSIALTGIGGIGKTTLADALLRRLIGAGEVERIGWVTARQQRLSFDGVIQTVAEPKLAVGGRCCGRWRPSCWRTSRRWAGCPSSKRLRGCASTSNRFPISSSSTTWRR